MTITPVPKPTSEHQEEESWRSKAMTIAGKIACFHGRCAMCGRLGMIFPHHIIHRTYGNTCALVENLIPLCAICHSDVHHDEARFKAWLEQRVPGLYDKLWDIARPVCTLDFMTVYKELLERYYDMLKGMNDKNPIR